MSGLHLAPSVPATAAPTAFFGDPPSPDALGADDLDLLNQLLETPDPIDLSVAFQRANAPSEPATTQRKRCVDCSSPMSGPCAKRPRASSADGKANKSKSQSQRQKEEIALLKQQVEELNDKLVDLQERKRQREMAGASTTDPEVVSPDQNHWSTATDISSTSTVVTESASSPKSLWRRIARRQLAELNSVEQENSSLRDEVAKRWKQMKSLERSIVTAKMDQLRQLNRHSQADELGAVISSA